MGTELDLRRGARLLAAAAAALLAVATMTGACALDREGSLTGAGGQGGSGENPCDFCPGADTDCTYRTCEAGECGIADSFVGILCNEDDGIVCDGAGNCVQCTDAAHCAPSQVCDQNHCVAAACVNGALDPGETDVDCGGDCAPCLNGMICVIVDDCVSLFCDCSDDPCRCQSCVNAADCNTPAEYCDQQQGTCLPIKEPGDNCLNGLECSSSFCAPVDNVCCDDPCDGTCEACLASKTGDPDGTCALVLADTDLDGECIDGGAASCGIDTTGCDGTAPACNLYPVGTICQPAGCSGGQETGESTCAGDGSPCPPFSQKDCLAYACDTDTCFTSCSGQAECATGYDCDGNNECKLVNGADCNDDNDCASDLCNWEGVCCNTDCDQGCESCVRQYNGNQAFCAFIVAGQDPYQECGSPPSNNCDGDGTC